MTVNLADFFDSNKNVDLDQIKSLGIEQVESLWNSLQVKGFNGLTERDKIVKIKCIEVLESGYRRPWDEPSIHTYERHYYFFYFVVFFKMIQMRLGVAECEEDNQMNVLNHINQIKKLFNELEVTCPFLPKAQLKRSLELKGKFTLLKLKDAIINERMNLDQNITDIIQILVEYKKKSFNISQFAASILDVFKTQVHSLTAGSQLESLIPECEEFKDFHVDLLNILTELTLNLAIECKKNAKFSEYVTDAINLNARSLNLRPNVMGYFEFLKLTKLQEDPRRKGVDFDQAIETCLMSLKNRVSPNEDIKGKLQIIRLISNETKSIERAVKFASELFVNCDFNDSGPMIFEEMITLIEEDEKLNSFKEIEGFLEKFTDHLRSSQRNQECVLGTLFRLAEKNWTLKKDYKKSEGLISIIQNFGFNDDDEGIKLKMAKCYLRLDKLKEAKDIMESIQNETRDNVLVLLEMYLRAQDEFNASECIERLLRDPTVRQEHFLNIYNLLKERLSSEIKMQLLKSAQGKMITEDSRMKIDILRGIITILYDCVIESGLTLEYKRELESNLEELSRQSTMEKDQIIWTCQVCWNLGVVHARAEDFSNAQFGFKWCQEFSSKSEESRKEFNFKATFYYLTAKLCTEDSIDDEFDYKLLSLIDNGSLEVNCVKIEMLLRSRKWKDLSDVLKKTSISFVTLAEIILRASEDVPLEIYRLILEKLSEDEFNSGDTIDICRFAGLYRGLTTCSLLQYPNDMGHFNCALEMIKGSFGRYPGDEIVWLCGTALEMGRQCVEISGNWHLAGQWTEIALNLVYLIPVEEERLRIIKTSLQESVI